jgi:hypothetical protein
VGLATKRINPVRVFAGPLVAGLVMAGVLLAASLPLIPSLVLGPLVYGGVLYLIERLLHPGDVELALSIARARPGKPLEPQPG